MPGNSQRRGRRTTPKGTPAGGSGSARRRGGKGRTLPASERPWHKAYAGDEPMPRSTARKKEREKRAAAEARAQRGGAGRGRPAVVPGRKANPPKGAPELLVGRLPVLEALRAHVPATALYLMVGVDVDERITEIRRIAGDQGVPVLEVSRAELDRLTGGVLHQGVGLQVPPYAYEPFDDLLAAAQEHTAPLLVAMDGVADPRTLGGVIRSAAALGAHGVFMPERRSVEMTATAWRTSAGAAARIPVARVTNLTRALKTCQEAGFMVVGLDADAELDLYDLELATGPLVLVVGSEGRGMTRLVAETCDMRVAIPMTSDVETLNAGVAAAIALAEVNRRRRTQA